ncbi:HAMP domain-containing sensor histidine kinase [Catenulispora subtropica]|uniref:histidine kinase n=1 Tax=Catenulispora subtropica TaxID=450798 RepID=A0ABP5DUR4_9ACTN
MKLSTRFAWMSAATLPVLVLAAGAALVPWETADLRAERDAHLHARAELLVPQAGSLAAQSTDPGSRVRQALQAPDDSVVIAARGSDVAVGDTPPAARLPLADGAFSVRDGVRTWRGYSASDAAAGTRVWVVEPETVLTAKVRKLRGRVWLMALIVSPVTFGVGALLGRRTIRPLTILRNRAGLVSAGTGARIALRTRVEEVDEVAAVLDEALARRDDQERQTVEAWQAARSFAATAAHELRTPLTAVQVALDVLEHPGAGEEDRAAALADLREAHGRVLGLLDVLRALSRVELTRAESFTAVDLAEIAEAALHAARGRHAEVRYEMRVEGVVGAAVMVGWGDGLRMVVDNLLDNAAVHGGGTVTLGVWQRGDAFALTVEDEGPGIPPELRTRVFERFSKAGSSRGFGLGLTIVAQVVALHGGSVEAGATPTGRGARFTVRLPAGPVGPATPVGPAGAVGPAGPVRPSQGFPKVSA